ncbi:MAG: MucR family transcriptional regulator [Phenylobacterium sp.]
MTDLNLLALTARIVASYVETNQTPPHELPGLICRVRESLAQQHRSDSARVDVVRPSAAQIRGSVRRDSLVSFLNGKRYKCLKRHISGYGLTPEGYRTRFGLPANYPVVAAEYSERRSAIAKVTGLGKHAVRRRTAQDDGVQAVHRT